MKFVIQTFKTAIKLAVFVAVTSFSSVCIASEQQKLEYKLKALYLIRLAEFISWPESSEHQTFKICIDASDQVANQLRQSTTSNIKGRKLEIIDPPTDSSISQCAFLYLSQGQIQPSLTHTPVFTVSSQENFAEQGGMIEFYIDRNNVRMKCNLQSVNKAGIKLSSKLIRLLKIVEPLEKRDD